MKNHPYKNFYAYRLSAELIEHVGLEVMKPITMGWAGETVNEKLFDGGLGKNRSRDPLASQWGSLGWVPPLADNAGELIEDIGQGVILLCAQFNERILPGKVRDEKLRERITKVEEMEGRRVYKSEYAQLRDEVEASLLPRAFIRRSKVYVMITRKGFMFIFTSSAKRADTVAALLRDSIPAFGGPNAFWVYRTERNVLGLLREVAKFEVEDEENGVLIKATDAAVLQGADKRTIRIKGVDIYSEDVADLLPSGYEPSELRVKLIMGSDTLLTITLGGKYCYKAMEIPGVEVEDGDDEDDALRSFSFLVADAIHDLLGTLASQLGGEQEPKPIEEAPTEPQPDELDDEEDDEL